MSDALEMVPVASIVGEAIKVKALYPDEVITEVVLVAKILDGDGDDYWSVRYSDGIRDMELVGVLTVELDRARGRLQSSFERIGDDDDAS